MSKLNPKCESFFQYPRKNWSLDDNIWYEARPVSVNSRHYMMKNISEAVSLVSLSKPYTNHSVRTTAKPFGGLMQESQTGTSWRSPVTEMSKTLLIATRAHPRPSFAVRFCETAFSTAQPSPPPQGLLSVKITVWWWLTTKLQIAMWTSFSLI